MRVLRDHHHQACVRAVQNYSTTPQPSLEAVGKLWAKWGIHGLMLVSFGLQVFLFFAAGLRRRSASRILQSLLWLAYLSADSVAIFVLGHLAVQASEPRHQLLFLWAPFVLLHLGGQPTITAFSMLDNELWRRHLLGLVTQVGVAGYVVSRSSWPDRRLLAAMVLMFLSGCLRYAGRTWCLYRASPAMLKESSLASLRRFARDTRDADVEYDRNREYERRIHLMLKAEGSISYIQSIPSSITSSAAALVSDTPLNDRYAIVALPSFIQCKLQELKYSSERCMAYKYVGTRLILIYDYIYTKAPLHSILRYKLGACVQFLFEIIPPPCRYSRAVIFSIFLFFLPVFTLLVLFPFLLTSASLVLFVVAKKGQLYSQADVIVSYILLIGAIILEAMSLFTFILFIATLTKKNIFHVRKPWSEMLGQYNMIKSLTRQEATGMMSFVPQWISKNLDDKTITHIPISEDLKKFVLDKLIDFGTRIQDWNFANFRGQLALREWKSSPNAMSGTSLHKSISDVEFPTSVLFWHIATDIVYFQDNTNTNYGQQMKKLSKELSNYIMYIVLKCGAMLTNTTELLHNNALGEMKACFEQCANLCEKDAMKKIFEAKKSPDPTWTISDPVDQIQLLKNTSETLVSPLLPRACEVAQELIDIQRESDRWNLISSVWLEMLYYIAPRCGGAFHTNHLATGGEFITHVLFLMQLLGPFLPPPGA